MFRRMEAEAQGEEQTTMLVGDFNAVINRYDTERWDHAPVREEILVVQERLCGFSLGQAILAKEMGIDAQASQVHSLHMGSFSVLSEDSLGESGWAWSSRWK